MQVQMILAKPALWPEEQQFKSVHTKKTSTLNGLLWNVEQLEDEF